MGLYFGLCMSNVHSGMVSLQLSNAYTASKPFVLLTQAHQHTGTQGVGRGHSQDTWHQVNRGIFHTIWCYAQHRKLREEGGMKDIQSDGVWLSKLLLDMLEPCLTRDGWVPTYPWETANEFLRVFCLSWGLLLYSLKCLYVIPWVITFTLLIFSLILLREWMSGSVVHSCWLELSHPAYWLCPHSQVELWIWITTSFNRRQTNTLQL